MKAAFILGLMVLLVPPKRQEINGEKEADAKERYSVIAQAIADESKGDHDVARFLTTVVRHESSFARSVHLGSKKGDGGKSWCLAQINIGTNPKAKTLFTWYEARSLVGTEYPATRRCVHTAAEFIRMAMRMCKDKPRQSAERVRCVFLRYGGVSKEAARLPWVREVIDARMATYGRLQKLRSR